MYGVSTLKKIMNWEQISKEAEKHKVCPIKLALHAYCGREPTQEEYKQYIDIVVMPTNIPIPNEEKIQNLKKLIRENNGQTH